MDPWAEARIGEEVAQDRVNGHLRGDPHGLWLDPEQVPGPSDVDQAVALVGRVVAGDEPGRRVERHPQLGRRVADAPRLGGAEQERSGAGGLWSGHRRAVEHAVAGRQRVRAGDRLADLPGRHARDRRAWRHDLRLERAVLRRTARAERMEVVDEVGIGAVVALPGLLRDVRPHRHRLGDDGWITDRVRTCAAVAGREEHLRVVVLDEAVVEHCPRVVAVVERRQTADAHVDDVHVGGLDRVDHSLDQGVRGAARDEEADANVDDLRPWGCAAHLAAEEPVAGGNARDMRAVRAGDDADVDEEEAGDRIGSVMAARRTEPTPLPASPDCRARSSRCRG